MKYQPGDKILVLLSNEEGEVIEVMDDKMVMIEVNGVRFPTYLDQIDFPYFKRFTEKKLFPNKKLDKLFIDDLPKEKLSISTPATPARMTQSGGGNQQLATGVWLYFLPKFSFDEFNDEVVDSLKIYLVNRTALAYTFFYSQQFLGKINFEHQNDIPAFQDFYLHDIAFEDLNDSPSFHAEFSLAEPQKTKAEYFETSLKLKPRQTFQRIEEMKKKNEPGFSYQLFEEYPDKKAEEDFEVSSLANKGYKIYEAKHIRQNLEPARSVVDLHIEKLVGDWKRLSNFEILTIQLKEFEKWYELAIAHYQSHLTVIHGVGSGKLRDEIHELLKAKREVKNFINQYHPRYGYGATEIAFQY